jgi:hypothetical protein
MAYFSNREAREAPEGYVPAQILDGGAVKGPECCGTKMADNGECAEGCCDDFKCETCGHMVRIEWPA